MSNQNVNPATVPIPASFGTNAVHAGQEPDPVTGAVIPSISVSTTFKQNGPGDLKAGYDYSRSGNPTREGFETAVATLEGGKHGLAFSSGSATTATILNTLKAGDHVISVNDVYGGTNRYFNKVATPIGMEASFVDMSNLDNIRNAFKPNTKIVWVETPTNPTLRIVDIRAVAAIVKEQRAKQPAPAAGTIAWPILVVDNTFLSPYFQRPLSLGADIVVHSVTKYLNGHSDAIMGVAITSDEAIHQRLRFLQNAIGAVPSPLDCFLANRGLKTLHLRMQQHERNAIAIAQFLAKHPHVTHVIYPGLPSHPQHEIARSQQSGYGGMISFGLKVPSVKEAKRFFDATKLFTLAESLGGVESLCEIPAVMTHAGLRPEERQALGITDTLVRLSCGIEETEDLIKDLDNAIRYAVDPNAAL